MAGLADRLRRGSPAPQTTASRRSAASAVADRKSRNATSRRRRLQAVAWLAVTIVVGVGAFVGGLLGAPLNYNFQPAAPKSVLLLDSAGDAFATIRSPQTVEPVAAGDIPMVMREAMVAAEDERFYSHRGVDPLAAARAAWRDLSGRSLQGGSTITQQYVKNVYTGSERTGLRKLREASLAIRLEQHLTKDEILTRYLNTLYLGNGTAGVQSASRFYFGVPIKDIDLDPATGLRSSRLGLARAATLAGIAPAPSIWNPLHDPKEARVRELYVLNRMEVAGRITPAQAGAAYGHHLPHVVAAAEPDAATIAPEFRDKISEQLTKYGDDTLFNTGGVQVKTTLDINLQQAAIDALKQVLPHLKGLDAAVAAVDPRTGDLRALTEQKVGGYAKNGLDVADPPYSSINRISGSTIKPFTLAVALEHGHTLGEGHPAPECLTVPYKLCNAEGGAGYYSLQSALEQSINTVYAPLAVDVGLRRIVKFARRTGLRVGPLTCHYTKHKLCPSYALGIPISPMSEAVAYGSFVTHGIHHPVRTLLGVRSATEGQLFKASNRPQGTRVMPAKVADDVATAMQGVVDHGTGTAARQDFPIYGKTGTTDHFTNAWFTGCSRSLCITVWMGYEQGSKSLRVNGEDVFGGTFPAKIFARTFQNFRTLQHPPPHASRSPSPSPSSTPAPYVTPTAILRTRRPTSRPTRSASRKPTPPPSKSAPPPATHSASPPSSPKPSPTGSGILSQPP